ncbi:MAG: restriction endonuclease [Citromicrobium sp.]|nr:MAG: restriction endonuclease [Citromicrobium sp.]
MSLPPLLAPEEIRRRLSIIFPKGTPRHNYCVGRAAMAAVYGSIYVGAIEGADRWAGPARLVRLSDQRATSLTSDEDREAYLRDPEVVGKRWYAENSRETIRDDTIRQSLIPLGAFIERGDIATNAQNQGYALSIGFAHLFDPNLSAEQFENAAALWRAANLSPQARSRVAMMAKGAATGRQPVLVTLPNGEARRLDAGPSSLIAKAVVEDFAQRYLQHPAVLWISESGRKVAVQDDELAARMNIVIDAKRILPDIILVDIGTSADEFMVIFVEVVASDGPMDGQRVAALKTIAANAGFDVGTITFITAYWDRDGAAFKKTFATLSPDTFAWCATQPDILTIIVDGGERRLRIRDITRLWSLG